jgi:hypothetical protein
MWLKLIATFVVFTQFFFNAMFPQGQNDQMKKNGLVPKPIISILDLFVSQKKTVTRPKIQTYFYYFSMTKTNNHQYNNLMPITTRLYNSNQNLKGHQII